MTREEAINFGEMFLAVNKDSKNSSTYEFVEMAIKALEQDPALDKIRAEIEELNPVDYVSMSSYEGHRGARDMKADVLQIIDKYKDRK